MTNSTRTAHATMSFSSWDEDPGWGPDAPLPRLAQALVAFAYEGDLTATSSCRYSLSYGLDGRGTAVGFEAVDGALDGMAGGLVIRHEAAFTPDGVELSFEVVEGSGTGGLEGITGSGTSVADHGSPTSPWSLTYRLPSEKMEP
ncbi:DUF3224 domain-containing protein [soil metagenome]